MCTRLSAVRPPQRPKSTSELALAKFHLARKPPRSTTGGKECSGMSRNVVTPPAASARRAGLETFPFRTAGFVEMHVWINQPRQHVKIAGVQVRVRAAEHRRAQRRDHPVLDAEVQLLHAGGQHHGGTADDQIKITHEKPRKGENSLS